MLAGCAGAPWSRGDKAMLGVSIACHGVDYAQTEWAMEHGYRELNPLMGDAPSDGRIAATKLATQALIYKIADASEDRLLTLGLALVPCLATVAHNYANGARP